MKKKKVFSYEIFCEPLQGSESYYTRAMFGGLAIYYNDLMVLMLAESPGDREYRGHSYEFDLWNGILVPTDRPHHSHLKSNMPELINHPILAKWLFLPANCNRFELCASELIDWILKSDPKIGIVPGQSRRKKK
ncbi:MAG: TfoX/Sxy family protein [Bdellovibrionales bacterium]|nr:TfoX/Sxy family protein [Bdellovibrionales bacterium]